jgi:hypothetical protein
MRNPWPILVLLCVLASLLVPGIASASTASGAETRVGVFDLPEQAIVGGSASLTLEPHPGCALAYEELASDSLLAARGATRATAHGAERLAQSGFTDDLVRLTKSEGQVLRQADGATVYLRESAPGRFDFIVEGERGVITAHTNMPQRAIDGLASRYGWK